MPGAAPVPRTGPWGCSRGEGGTGPGCLWVPQVAGEEGQESPRNAHFQERCRTVVTIPGVRAGLDPRVPGAEQGARLGPARDRAGAARTHCLPQGSPTLPVLLSPGRHTAPHPLLGVLYAKRERAPLHGKHIACRGVHLRSPAARAALKSSSSVCADFVIFQGWLSLRGKALQVCCA